MFQQTWQRILRELDSIRKAREFCDPRLEALEGAAWVHGNEWLRQKAIVAFKNLRRCGRNQKQYRSEDLGDLIGVFNCALNSRIPISNVVAWLAEIDPRIVGLELNPKALTWVLAFKEDALITGLLWVTIYDLRDIPYGDAGFYHMVKVGDGVEIPEAYILQ